MKSYLGERKRYIYGFDLVEKLLFASCGKWEHATCCKFNGCNPQNLVLKSPVEMFGQNKFLTADMFLDPDHENGSWCWSLKTQFFSSAGDENN